ncbi:hypothetical protein Q8A67_022888 [Cirrhinus molitorella]|uniref:Uncharacterized protein n=1 Tax=Cirrhinus molitorella TaxID=172907 RepID=A0AA88P2L2_9TELE|nr:hypothetical protein Q8A67_022888 [Cirrhinus molitorella]
MRNSSVMCGGVMGDLSRGDGGAMRKDYSMSMATFHSTALLSRAGCGTGAEGSPGKEQPGKKVFSASGEEQQALSLQVVKEQRAGEVEWCCLREADGWGKEENKACYTQLQEGCNQ